MIRAYKIAIACTILTLGILALLNRTYLSTELTARLTELPDTIAALLMLLAVTVGIVLLVPNSILFFTSGALFGIKTGFLISFAGFVIGSTLAFLIARNLAREAIDRHAHDRITYLRNYISSAGWKAIAVLRVIPIMPAFLLNYLLGLTYVSLRDYVLVSALFIAPSCLLITFTGATGREILIAGEISLQSILILISMVILLIALRRVVSRRLGVRSEQNRAP